MSSKYWKWSKQYISTVYDRIDDFDELCDLEPVILDRQVNEIEELKYVLKDDGGELLGLCVLNLKDGPIKFADIEKDVLDYILYCWMEAGEIVEDILIDLNELERNIPDDYLDDTTYEIPISDMRTILDEVSEDTQNRRSE